MRKPTFDGILKGLITVILTASLVALSIEGNMIKLYRPLEADPGHGLNHPYSGMGRLVFVSHMDQIIMLLGGLGVIFGLVLVLILDSRQRR